MVRHLFIDTETGGLDPNKHSLLTIGLCVADGDRIVDKLEIKIKQSDYVVTAGALKVNKIKLEDLDMTPDKCIPLMINFINNYFPNKKPMLCGHNVGFDIGFFKKFWNDNVKALNIRDTYAYHNMFDYHSLDTMCIAEFLKDIGKLNIKNVKLETLCTELSIENVEAHTALSDAISTALVYDKLTKLINK